MLRAVLKATDLCASDPRLVSRRLVEEGFAERYDYALQTLTELPYRSWREFDPEDSMRFYALRMHEIGFISASPTAVIAEGTEAAHEEGQRLQTLGAAPEFALTSQDGAEVTLASLRGKVVAVTFIYTSCPDVCPMLTDKLARVQDALGRDFGSRIAFVSITTDPERDTPEVLKGYAEAFEANLAGWSFLTGKPATVLDVAHRYGVAVAKAADGQVDHTMLTTLIDRQGTMRVQYLGYRFDEEEFRRDLQSLVNEP